MTMVDTIEADGTEMHVISHASQTQLIAEARSRNVKRIEIHEFDELWPDPSECPSMEDI